MKHKFIAAGILLLSVCTITLFYNSFKVEDKDNNVFAFLVNGVESLEIPNDPSAYYISVDCTNGAEGTFDIYSGQFQFNNLTSTSYFKCNINFRDKANLPEMDGKSSYWLLNGPEKERFASLKFVNTNVVPSDADGSWDASEQNNGKIMGWYYVNEDGLYEGFIGQEGSVLANENSVLLLAGMTNLKSVDLTYLDTSNVINMQHFFTGCHNLTTITGLTDTKKVTNMAFMFSECRSLKNLSFMNGWNTSKVTNMSNMFQNATIQDFSHFVNLNTSNVADMSGLFYGIETLTDLNQIAGLNVSGITNTASMFTSTKIANVNLLSSWDMSKVTDISNMFYGIETLTDISGLANWDTSNVENMNAMFVYNKFTDTSALANWNTSKVKTMSALFWEVKLVNVEGLRNWNTTSVTDMSSMFYNTNITIVEPLKDFLTQKVLNMRKMFYGCPITDGSSLDNWDLTGIISSNYMQYYDPEFYGQQNPTYEMFSGTLRTNLPNWEGTKSDGRHYYWYSAVLRRS